MLVVASSAIVHPLFLCHRYVVMIERHHVFYYLMTLKYVGLWPNMSAAIRWFLEPLNGINLYCG